MVRHVHDGRDCWTLPGGAIEDRETEVEAAAREVFEETGIEIEGATRLFEEVGEVCFLASCAPDAVAKVGMDPEFPGENQCIKEVRWWRLEEKRHDLQVCKVIACINAAAQ